MINYIYISGEITDEVVSDFNKQLVEAFIDNDKPILIFLNNTSGPLINDLAIHRLIKMFDYKRLSIILNGVISSGVLLAYGVFSYNVYITTGSVVLLEDYYCAIDGTYLQTLNIIDESDDNKAATKAISAEITQIFERWTRKSKEQLCKLFENKTSFVDKDCRDIELIGNIGNLLDSTRDRNDKFIQLINGSAC